MRRGLFGLVVLFVATFGFSDAPAQQSETRIALIIANDAYVSPSLGRLQATQTDASLMRDALARSGFTVTVRTNLNRAQMRDVLSSFRAQLNQLGQRGVGFLYYSGHGIADGPRGQNYLVPVDAHIRNVTDLPSTSVALNEELDGIVLAGARATIIVIDACRNTPVSYSRGSRGLAAVSARTDTLIAFSTDAGEVAADDGLYARTLSEELGRPGVDAASLFARVQTRVALATRRAQRPRYDNGLIEPIVFGIVTGAPAPPPSFTRLEGLTCRGTFGREGQGATLIEISFRADGTAELYNTSANARFEWTWRQEGASVQMRFVEASNFAGMINANRLTGAIDGNGGRTPLDLVCS